MSECRITSAKERRRLRKNAAIGLESAFGARCAHGPCQDAGVHVGGTRVIDNEVLDVRSDERGIAGKQSKAATAP